MLEEGYIKLHRSITKWEWYQDANTARLFIHLLLTVNHTPQKWRGIVVERGQRVASYKVLSAELGLSEREIRTAVNHLKTTGELTLTTTPKYGLYTINNYDVFQEVTPKRSPERHSSDTQATPKRQQCKNDKNDKNDKNNTLAHFEAFWGAYPKKVGKQDALKKWNAIKPDDDLFDKIIKAVETQKKGEGWKKENGRYIPYPTTWLNRGDWDNEITPDKPERSYDTSKMTESVNFKWAEYVKEDAK